MAQAESISPPRSADCPCGSGLRHKHCCGQHSVTLPRPSEIQRLEPLYEAAQIAYGEGRFEDSARAARQVLQEAPGHLRSLVLLANVTKREGNIQAAEALFRRAVALNPNDSALACDLGLLLYEQRKFVEAHKHARNGIRLNPRNPQAHNLMGMVLTDQHRLHAGEFHYRRALELHPPVGKLCANLGLNLKNQGKVEEAREWYEKAIELEPENVHSLLGRVHLEEADRNIETATELLERADAISPAEKGRFVTRSVLHRRGKDYERALAALEEFEKGEGGAPDAAGYYYERGEVLDKLGRFDEAFEAYAKANAAVRRSPERAYDEQRASQLAERLKGFFARGRLDILPRGSAPAPGRPRPIFIVGFPRSGTTLVEQILSSHPNIVAGDELDLMWELTRVAPQMLNSDLAYPECLADLWLGQNLGALDSFRDYYLKKAELIGVAEEGVPWFTDKMPLNETHLGLIGLVFPHSPVIHLIRHPLDVVLSTFFIDLTHGFCCSYGLDTAAHHYALLRGLVDHYLESMDIRYLAIRYEDIVDDPETRVRELLEFVGEPWDPRCLEFHENRRYARTASYSQVTEPIYRRSVYRYKHYLRHLQDIVPVLAPAIARLGYEI